jgi:tyrosyl-tRNA synthetase
MQIGGADQWGNITTGIEMIRKLYGDDHKACGLTLNLLTKTDGTKFGKSEDGAIYLDTKYTSPHSMYQFLINQSDADVEKLLKVLTFYTQDEIKIIMKEHDNDKTQHYAQKKLADAIVGDVHGKTALAVATNVSRTLFTGDVSSLPPKELLEALSGTPTYKASGNKYTIVDLLVAAHVCPSKSNARQLITSKAISVNNKLIDSYDAVIDKVDAIEHKFSYIKKGKKNYFLILWV